jgi:type I restriction enzyme S subunit
MLPANRTVLFTSRAGIGDMAILCRPACTNQGFQSLIIREPNDPYFFYSTGGQITNYALTNASGSTFLEISGKQLAKMDIAVPDANEQHQIGAFFKQLDNLITLHQRKQHRQILSKGAILQ